MDPRLSRILAGHEPIVTEEATWGNGIRLRIAGYIGTDAPPVELVSSARAIVFRDDAVLVAQDQDGLRHILPGGRLDDGETPVQALHREIAEESGWEIGDVSTIGFLHYHHLTPRPEGYRYPFPDFLQVVFTARTVRFDPVRRVPDDYVTGTRFIAPPELRGMDLTPTEWVFLRAAMRQMQT